MTTGGEAKGVALLPLGAVLDFMRLIWAVDHGLQRRSKRMEVTHGVTAQQRLVLLFVGRFPSIVAGHLAELLHLHPSTLTGILRRLERQRLVSVRRDPRDARRRLLGLTPAGRSVVAHAEGTVEAAVRDALERTSSDAITGAEHVLRALAESLERGDVELDDG
jgi:MarR family transcriptional regulator, organic hydroperoxide resistance regulator